MSIVLVPKVKAGTESVLTALVPKKPVAQPVASINVHQKIGETPAAVEDRNKTFTYRIQESTNEVSCREKI